MSKPNKYVGGGAGVLLSGAWGFYSNITTIKDLPDDAGWIAKMIADPPIYAPWLLFACCILFLSWVFWQRDANHPDDKTPKATNETHGAYSPIFNNQGNAEYKQETHLHKEPVRRTVSPEVEQYFERRLDIELPVIISHAQADEPHHFAIEIKDHLRANGFSVAGFGSFTPIDGEDPAIFAGVEDGRTNIVRVGIMRDG